MNAHYSSMLTRFYHFFSTRILRPEVSLNNRRNFEEHERWFNSLEPARASADNVYAYEVDMSSYDRSQEHVALMFEAYFYKRMGFE